MFYFIWKSIFYIVVSFLLNKKYIKHAWWSWHIECNVGWLNKSWVSDWNWSNHELFGKIFNFHLHFLFLINYLYTILISAYLKIEFEIKVQFLDIKIWLWHINWILIFFAYFFYQISMRFKHSVAQMLLWIFLKVIEATIHWIVWFQNQWKLLPQ